MSVKSSGLAQRRRSKAAPGLKPSIAYASEKAAKSNIERKLSLLSLMLRHAHRGDLKSQEIESLPKSMRQFNCWAPTEADGNGLLRNSRETLLKYPDLLASISQAVEALRSLRHTSHKAHEKERTLEAARRTGALNKLMREIAERELVRMRSALHSAQRALIVSEAKLESMTKECARLRNEDGKEIERLRAESADLRRRYREVVPLRSK